MKEYWEDSHGIVHLGAEINSEYMVCGEPCIDGGDDEWLPNMQLTSPKIVTCPGCIREIKNCRKVRTAKEQDE